MSELVPSESHYLAEVAVEDGAPAFASAPRWFTEAIGEDHRFPIPLRGELRDIAAGIAGSGRPVHDRFLELARPGGEVLALLVQGKIDDRPSSAHHAGPRVLLALRDVTDLLRQRRKAVLIGNFHGIIGQSLPMLDVFNKIALYGPTDAPVIITGETGTGKELVARALHERSKRAGKPFIPVNCTALNPELFESELFGHEKGSFTGAWRQHKGRFERANTGTLFLDEMGDMSLATQAKMLRALEEGVIERVGSDKEVEVDVRVVAATNVPLEQAVQLRRFRADLYHRLSVLRIHVPPLRERHGDLPRLVEFLLEIFNRRYAKAIRGVSAEALRILEDYAWPGNVRELRNVIERLVVEAQEDIIAPEALMEWVDEREYLMPGDWNADAFFGRRQRTRVPMPPLAEGAEDEEPDVLRGGYLPMPSRRSRELASEPMIVETHALPVAPTAPEKQELTADSIRAAAEKARGNLTQAARLLGVHKATLYRHMKALGIDREALEQAGG